MSDSNPSQWFVYILRCADDTLYTGVTTDLERRLHQHNHLVTGARYTRARRPVTLVWHCRADSHSAACQQEYRIKQLSRAEKQQLIEGKLS